MRTKKVDALITLNSFVTLKSGSDNPEMVKFADMLKSYVARAEKLPESFFDALPPECFSNRTDAAQMIFKAVNKAA